MIDGTEPITGYGTDNYDVIGLTIKQHMVIEFSKALISSCNWNDSILDKNLMDATATKAIELTNVIIKQFNKNGDT